MRRVDRTISRWHAEVVTASLVFERRWTQLALRRVDPDIAERLHRQRNLFTEACVRGTPEDVETHGAAMLRGYLLACSVMEASQEADDAYQIGECPRTGTRVVIGPCKASLDRVREINDHREAEGVLEQAIHLTPDEVASLFGSVAALKDIGVIKRRFPGAEVTETREVSNGEEKHP